MTNVRSINNMNILDYHKMVEKAHKIATEAREATSLASERYVQLVLRVRVGRTTKDTADLKHELRVWLKDRRLLRQHRSICKTSILSTYNIHDEHMLKNLKEEKGYAQSSFIKTR